MIKKNINMLNINKKAKKNITKEKNDLYKSIFDWSFSIEFNLNDTFHWGTSDSCFIDSFDLSNMKTIIGLYGYDVIIAYEAIRREYDPDPIMKISNKESYQKAKKAIMELMEDDTKLYELKSFLTEKEIINNKK